MTLLLKFIAYCILAASGGQDAPPHRAEVLEELLGYELIDYTEVVTCEGDIYYYDTLAERDRFKDYVRWILLSPACQTVIVLCHTFEDTCNYYRMEVVGCTPVVEIFVRETGLHVLMPERQPCTDEVETPYYEQTEPGKDCWYYYECDLCECEPTAPGDVP